MSETAPEGSWSRKKEAAPWLIVFVLTVVCCISATIDIWRVTTVPFLQQPDELAHYDYVSAIYEAGGPFRVIDPVTSTHATAEARYLIEVMQYRQLRYNTDLRPYPTSRESIRNELIDAAAPPRVQRSPQDHSVPYASLTYPVGYYLTAATVEWSIDTVLGRSITRDITAIRLIGLPLLLLTVICTYDCITTLGARRVVGLGLAATVALLPSITTIFAYVQPDAATTAMVSATTAAFLRWRRSGGRRAMICFVIAASCITAIKAHYGIITFGAFAITAIAGSISRGATAHKLLIIGGLLQFVTLGLDRLSSITTITPPFGATTTGPHAEYDIPHLIIDSLITIYAGGNAFASFWYAGGVWLSEKSIPDWSIMPFTAMIVAVTIVTFWLIIRGVIKKEYESRFQQVASALDNPLVVVYVVWTGFLISADVISKNDLGLLGRYWAPVIIPIVSALPVLAAKKNKEEKIISLGATAAWIIVAVGLCACDITRTYRDWIAPVAVQKTHINRFLVVDSIHVENETASTSGDDFVITTDAGQNIVIKGWGIDDANGSPASRAYAEVDEKRYQLQYGLPTPTYIVARLSDDDLKHIGFAGSIATSGLTRGNHPLRIFLDEGHGKRSYWAGRVVIQIRDKTHKPQEEYQ